MSEFTTVPGHSASGGPSGTRGGGAPRGTWRRALRAFALLLLACGAAAILVVSLAALSRTPRLFFDFENFYSAGTILSKDPAEHLYDLKTQERIENQVVPEAPFLPFLHPPPEALVFSLLARFPFRLAFLVWSGFNILVFAFAVFLLRYAGEDLNPDGRIFWALAVIPLVSAPLALGQDSLLLFPVFLFAFLALKRGKEAVAGSLFGLGTFRFEVLIPFILIFALRRRWKVVAGFAATGAAGFAVSLWMLGRTGVAEYIRLLLRMGSGHGGVYATARELSLMPDLHGALSTLLGHSLSSHVPFIWAAGSLALLCWAAWEFDSVAMPNSEAFVWEYSLCLVCTLLATYPLFNHELTPLILVAYLVIARESYRQTSRGLRDSPGTTLLLLLSLSLVAIPALGLRAFSVLAIVLFGLAVFLAREAHAARAKPQEV